MRSLPYFPIVPRNAPPDDLRSYLDLYSREAVGMHPPPSPTHAEWDVNLPIPRMWQRWGSERSQILSGFGTVYEGPVVSTMRRTDLGNLGRGFGAVGGRLERDPASYDSTRVAPPFVLGDVRIVPTLWAQRGLNAAGIYTVTDGRSGPATLAGLRTFYTRFRLSPPIPAIYDSSHISMSLEMELALASLTQVADVDAAAPRPTPATTPEPTIAPSTYAAGGGLLVAAALGVGAALSFGRSR